MAAAGSVAQDFQGIADLSVCIHLTITCLGECAWSVHDAIYCAVSIETLANDLLMSGPELATVANSHKGWLSFCYTRGYRIS